MPNKTTNTGQHQPLDEETAAALTLYNTYLIADREQQAHKKAVKKAEQAKDAAAATVRKLHERKASGTEAAEAEKAYREAVEALQRLRDGTATVPQDDDSDDSNGDDSGGNEDDDSSETTEASDAETEAPGNDSDDGSDADSDTDESTETDATDASETSEASTKTSDAESEQS